MSDQESRKVRKMSNSYRMRFFSLHRTKLRFKKKIKSLFISTKGKMRIRLV